MSDRNHDSLVEHFGDRLRGDSWQPDVDVFETETALVVRAEIAGVRSQDLNVRVDGQILRIAGIRPAPDGSRVKRLHQMEIASGPFERRLRIQIPFDRNGVSAHVEDGFLTVTLPKSVAGPRRVPVKF
ncbi:MAG: Hsp20/alpha crystallin family protein [Deltaproteobacteria bacterium]|nr:Hsp20/alpha crystallin family protein [Deltaproteobacteria bacterium]